jgi:hypothetical protein
MKKFNLLKEIISIDKPAFTAAINGGRTFGITTGGEIVYAPFDDGRLYVWQGSVEKTAASPLTPAKPKTLAELLGGKLQVVEVEDRILVKAAGNWQEIMRMNLPRADYDDTTADGVDEFADETLETIGWHATEFDITYRDLLEVIESQCDGTILCIEREGENYQFSGMGFIDDHECARERCTAYCRDRIAKTLEEDDIYRTAGLTDDEEEALEYFGIPKP